MCGFVGFFSTNELENDKRLNNLERMSMTIAHRGPNGYGSWIDTESGISLAHRRLSIIDLSAHGHQPMISNSGRYKIVFNGEIYNYLDLKKEINDSFSIDWIGSSDTEIMLAAFDIWGIKKSLQKFNGMFSFALWDLKDRKLYLGRDRIGEKPLYYGWCQDSFIFGSELKALKAHSSFDKRINFQAIELYLKYNYIPEPLSIYEDIFKLEPGSILCLDLENFQKKTLPSCQNYWSLAQTASFGEQNPHILTDDEAINHLDHLLHKAVQRQMVADVPIGAFLSGGIDSSTIVALMQKSSQKPIKTFTIGFDQSDLNEAVYAKNIANYLKTDHTEIYVSDQQALDVIPLLFQIYDEPFADSSQIPTYLVSKLAKQQVSVCLSGDGGDELLGGYNRHIKANQLESLITNIPPWGRNLLGNLIEIVPASFLNKTSELSSQIFSQKKLSSHFGDKIRKFSKALKGNREDIHQKLMLNFQDTSQVMLTIPPSIYNKKKLYDKMKAFTHQMMLDDSLDYLPGDILVKVDRASMAVSLETRIPMLDKEVIEFAWRLPLSLKIKNGKGKWILRQVLGKYIPSTLIERPKQGFDVPLDIWLRGPLSDWADSLLNNQALKDANILNPSFVQQMWQQHKLGHKNYQNQLWSLLMLQNWIFLQK